MKTTIKTIVRFFGELLFIVFFFYVLQNGGECWYDLLPDHSPKFTSYFKIEFTDGTFIETTDHLRITKLSDEKIKTLNTETGERTVIKLTEGHKIYKISEFYSERENIKTQ